MKICLHIVHSILKHICKLTAKLLPNYRAVLLREQCPFQPFKTKVEIATNHRNKVLYISKLQPCLDSKSITIRLGTAIMTNDNSNFQEK